MMRSACHHLEALDLLWSEAHIPVWGHHQRLRMPLGVKGLDLLLHRATQNLVMTWQADDTVSAAMKLCHMVALSFVV